MGTTRTPYKGFTVFNLVIPLYNNTTLPVCSNGLVLKDTCTVYCSAQCLQLLFSVVFWRDQNWVAMMYSVGQQI